MFDLTKQETTLLKKLSTPGKIQDFLDALPMNTEEHGDTCHSPRWVLRENKAHCIEGALLAALALYIQGEKPLLLDLKTKKTDQEHVVALFRKNGYWGALSKTNHSVLRYRDPIYKTVRELALSYFHEYFLVKNGDKTLVSFSRPFSLELYDHEWMTSEENLFGLAADLDDSPHFKTVPVAHRRLLRKASRVERLAADIPEWNGQERIKYPTA
ncbi:MAG: hypothetical protein KBC83_01975 [Candidatus Moranbacteria bacterium]|jgi:hypothetical protein|nr:hypothetical protein [Candidatus Moranbacteria bacterium]MBP9801418.1 hypothetical protein [Candidatus Moranbacteria bacterium]